MQDDGMLAEWGTLLHAQLRVVQTDTTRQLLPIPSLRLIDIPVDVLIQGEIYDRKQKL